MTTRTRYRITAAVQRRWLARVTACHAKRNKKESILHDTVTAEAYYWPPLSICRRRWLYSV